MKKTCLVILAPGFEEIEAVAPIDILRRGDVSVTIAGVQGLSVRGKQEMVMQADRMIQDALKESYDCLLLPGGPGVQMLLDTPVVVDLARQYLQAGRLVGAICAAPIVLQRAGVLEGRHYTAHFSVADCLPKIQLNQSVIVDGNLITANGPGAALLFSLRLLAYLTSPVTAESVATSMCLTEFTC